MFSGREKNDRDSDTVFYGNRLCRLRIYEGISVHESGVLSVTRDRDR